MMQHRPRLALVLLTAVAAVALLAPVEFGPAGGRSVPSQGESGFTPASDLDRHETAQVASADRRGGTAKRLLGGRWQPLVVLGVAMSLAVAGVRRRSVLLDGGDWSERYQWSPLAGRDPPLLSV